MERRIRLISLVLLPVVITATAFLALASAEPAAQTAPEASACLADLSKWIEPTVIDYGQSTSVTLVVSSTCPAEALPVDLVILADESNSMTPPERSARIPTPIEPTKRPTPLPTGATPPKPTEPPPPDPNVTPGSTPGGSQRGGEPPFCNPVPNDGGIIQPTSPVEPTKGPTRVGPPTDIPPPGPVQNDPGQPGDPGPITTQPAVQPTMTTEELEPSGGDNEIRNVQEFVQDLMRRKEIANDMESGRLRMGFVAFSKRARIRQSLTNEASRITSAASRMRSGEITKIDIAMREAERILSRGEKGDEDRVQVILILSDFQFCDRDTTIARRLGRDMIVVTQGFGVRNYDIRKVYDIASDHRYAFQRARVDGFIDIYEDELGLSRPVIMDTLVVTDQLEANMSLIPGSVDPPTVTITGQLLEWQFTQPAMPLTLGYEVKPEAAGLLPISVDAAAAYTDTEGLIGSGPFPPVSVEVNPPTPTPTATSTSTPTPTATNTPTATPTPGPRYMPIAYRNWPEPTPTPTITVCIPEEQTVDLALVIDTSTSMSDPTHPGGMIKLDAAIEAAEELVSLMKPEDQVSVIGFNKTANLATPLTSDKPTVRAALASLPGTQAQGTSIDVGLEVALHELLSSRHRAENHRSIVLVTDGRQTGLGGNAAVRAVAQQIRAAEIKLITVGLGSDVDEVLLREIASNPELYFPAPNADELKDIYREIARVIPC